MINQHAGKSEDNMIEIGEEPRNGSSIVLLWAWRGTVVARTEIATAAVTRLWVRPVSGEIRLICNE